MAGVAVRLFCKIMQQAPGGEVRCPDARPRRGAAAPAKITNFCRRPKQSKAFTAMFGGAVL